jgi:Na+-driven multidrug efflux pump
VALKLLGSALTAQGRPVLESSAIAVSFVATISLDILLIPRYGGNGAAFASSFAYCLGGAVACVVFVRAVGGRLLDLLPRWADVGDLWRGMRSLATRRAAAVGISKVHDACAWVDSIMLWVRVAGSCRAAA